MNYKIHGATIKTVCAQQAMQGTKYAPWGWSYDRNM